MDRVRGNAVRGVGINGAGKQKKIMGKEKGQPVQRRADSRLVGSEEIKKIKMKV